MRNQPTNIFSQANAPDDAGSRWHVDQRPTLRLAGIFVVITLPFLAVAGRLVYLQACLSTDFIGTYEETEERFEPIAARDGRILGSDGRVLADDVLHIDLSVHYRWLEKPADERWLRQQAFARLTPTERRMPERVEAAKQSVLLRRQEMWNRLAELTGTPLDELESFRQGIQDRVERIVESVERNRKRRARASLERSEASDGWWDGAWNAVVDTLTTTPERVDLERVVVTEELDYHRLIENVSLEVAATVEANLEHFPGMRVETSTQRVYPQGPLAAHIVGSRLPVTAEELEARAAEFPDGDPLDYHVGERMGKTGVERSYDRQLRGVDGLRKIVVVRRGSRAGEIVDNQVVREPKNGRDVQLTIDMRLQRSAEELLDGVLARHTAQTGDHSADHKRAGACIVAIDIHTGAVIVAASAPRFDLRLLTNYDAARWQQAVTDPRQPFFHRAIRSTLPPGSIFKTLSAVALLETGLVDPHQEFFCQGYLDNPNRYRCYTYRHYGTGHGDTNLSDAICRSCNVYFFEMARRLGPEPFVRWAQRFGFEQATGIDLPGERGGNLPLPVSMQPDRIDPASGDPKKPTPWYPGDTLQLAIGQSRLTVTPVQIARLMAAIANDGYLVTPHVVEGFGPAAATAESIALPAGRDPQRILGLSPDTLERVREGMRRVVADPRGTGYKTVRMKAVTIAGKSGTAEVGGGQQDHAWFAGFVPADEPRVAYAVVLEHAGSGGREAGPVAHQFIESLLEAGAIRATEIVARQ